MRVHEQLTDDLARRFGAAVQRQSPVPLHHQIKLALLNGMEEGWLEPGRRLPRERELAGLLGVSLAPLRQAMADLSKEGYLDRARGRGTFVRERKVLEKIAVLGSFHDGLRWHGIEPQMNVVVNEMTVSPSRVSTALGLRGGRVWSLRRIAAIGGEPVALLAAWMPARYATGLRTGRDFAQQSLYAGLAEVHGAVMTAADSLIEVVRPGVGDAEQLGVVPGSPVLKVVGITSDQNGRRVEYSEVLYDPDRFRFSVESRRTTNGLTYTPDAPREAPPVRPGAVGTKRNDFASTIGAHTAPTRTAQGGTPWPAS